MRLVKVGPQIIDSWVASWGKTKDAIRDQRRKDRNDKVDSQVYSFFMEKIVPQIEKSSPEEGAEAVKYIAKAIPQLTQVADPVSITDRILQSLATLAHLYDSRKFLLPGKEEAGGGSDTGTQFNPLMKK